MYKNLSEDMQTFYDLLADHREIAARYAESSYHSHELEKQLRVLEQAITAEAQYLFGEEY